MIPVFKTIGKRSTAKNYRPVYLLSVVQKDFEKLVSNRLADDLEKYGLFSDFQYGFRSFRYQLQIFWQLYLIELLGLLTSLGLLQL